MSQVEEKHSNVTLKADMDHKTNTFNLAISADTRVTPGLVLQYTICVLMNLAESSGIDFVKSLPDLLREAYRIKDVKTDLSEVD